MSALRAAFLPALLLLTGCITGQGEAAIDMAADFTDSNNTAGSVAFSWTQSEGDIEDDFYEFNCRNDGDFKEINVQEGSSNFSMVFRFDSASVLTGMDVNLLDGSALTNRSFDVDPDSQTQPLSEVDCTITGGYPDLTLNAECSDNVADPDYPDAHFTFTTTIACPRWMSVFE